MKLAIALRVYPKISKVPFVHNTDKLALFECSCRSLLKGLAGVDYQLHVILDSCPSTYTEMLQKVFPSDRLKLVPVDKMGNMSTFAKQIEILRDQDFGDAVFFAEDDYLYLPGSFAKMIQVLDLKAADFVTPYNHPDYKNLKLHSYKTTTQKIGQQEWYDVGSTCLTFLTTKEILKACEGQLLTYSNRNTDASMWFALTKKGVWNPLVTLPVMFSSLFFLRHYYLILKFSFAQLLFGRTYRLLAPRASLATHMEREFLAEGVDWGKVALLNQPEFSHGKNL